MKQQNKKIIESTNKTIVEQIVGNQINLTKNNVEKVKEQIIFELETGSKNPFDVLTEIEFISQVFEQVKSHLRTSLIQELEKYPGGSTTRNGVQLRLKETSVKYDFSTTEKWNELNQNIEEMKSEIKELESELKLIKSKKSYIDETTGEIVEFNIPGKSSKTTIEITLPK